MKQIKLPISLQYHFDTDCLGSLDMTHVDVTKGNLGMIKIPRYYYDRGLTGILLLPNYKFDHLEFMQIYSFDINDVNKTISKYYVSIYDPKFVTIPDREISIEEKFILYEYTDNNWSMLMNTFAELYNCEYNKRVIQEMNSDKTEVTWPDKSPDYRLL